MSCWNLHHPSWNLLLTPRTLITQIDLLVQFRLLSPSLLLPPFSPFISHHCTHTHTAHAPKMQTFLVDIDVSQDSRLLTCSLGLRMLERVLCFVFSLCDFTLQNQLKRMIQKFVPFQHVMRMCMHRNRTRDTSCAYIDLFLFAHRLCM